MRSRLGPILSNSCWAIAIVALGLAATGLQMDREARKNAAVAPMVPSAFRAYALETLARKAYAARDDEMGLTYSRALVEQRPVPAEGLSLLTKGLLAKGQGTEALPVLLLAAQRGWRDRFTQRLMAASAIQVGDTQVAAERLIALWRLGERDDQTLGLTQSLLTDSDGLKQFAKAIIKADSWGTGFLIWSVDKLPAPSIETIATALANKRVDVNCEQLSHLARTLAQAGNGKLAVSLWSKLCTQGPVTPASDFDFHLSAGEPGPFDWNFPDQAGLNISLAETGDTVSLEYDYDEQIRVVAAKRMATLPPGTHAVRIDADGGNAMEQRPMFLQVTCFAEDGTSKGNPRIPLGKQAKSFEIPSSGCAAQEIALLVSHGSGNVRSLIISR